jgi:cytochrome c biogenesis factor
LAEIGRLAVWVALLAGTMAVITRRRLALAVAVGGAAVGVLVLARALVANDFSLTYVADFSRRGASTPYRVASSWGGMAGSLLWFATLVGLAGLLASLRLGPRDRGALPDGSSDQTDAGNVLAGPGRAAAGGNAGSTLGLRDGGKPDGTAGEDVPGSSGGWLGRRGRPDGGARTVAGVTGGAVAVLAGLVLAFADPYRRLEVPAIEGAGLTPILEHPAMLYHPPLLYLGWRRCCRRSL